MRPPSNGIGLAACWILFAGSIWFASEWWEKGWASPIGEPDVIGLKALSHSGSCRLRFTDDTVKPEWLPWWGAPGFYRLYDHRNGGLIAETRVYDLAASGQLYWGNKWDPEVSAGNIIIGPNAPDCIGGGE